LLPSIGAALFYDQHRFDPGRSRPPAVAAKMRAFGQCPARGIYKHWVLLLGAAVIDVSSGASRAGLVALSLLLAILSYLFVEMPIRRNSSWTLRPKFALPTALALTVAANVVAIRWHNGASGGAARLAQSRYERVRFDLPVILWHGLR
jgi:hypothetical protein